MSHVRGRETKSLQVAEGPVRPRELRIDLQDAPVRGDAIIRPARRTQIVGVDHPCRRLTRNVRKHCLLAFEGAIVLADLP